MAHEQTNPAILMREGTEPGYRWRQYLVISDERVAIVHMVPALFGWNFGMVDIQGASDWPGMARDAIVAWKHTHNDGRTLDATLDDSARARLLAVAART